MLRGSCVDRTPRVQHRSLRFFDLQYEVRAARSREQQHVAPGTDAADADHPQRDIRQFVLGEQYGDVGRHRRAILLEQISDLATFVFGHS